MHDLNQLKWIVSRALPHNNSASTKNTTGDSLSAQSHTSAHMSDPAFEGFMLPLDFTCRKNLSGLLNAKTECQVAPA